jgi:hypothetical protein
MLRNTMIAAGLALVGALCVAAPVLAAPVATTGITLPLLTKSSNVEPAAYKRKRYVQRRPAWRYRHRGYAPYYRHRGFYYAPGIAIGAAPYYGDYDGYYDDDYGYAEGGDATGVNDEHVAWCMDRYRSYDQESDSFMGYDGYQHPCNSPFD